MPAKKTLRVNLAPKDEFEASIIGRILKWALTAGKSIVILTEFVVILAFLSRFKLDMDLNDLNEIIVQKQAIVESYADVEREMRQLVKLSEVAADGVEKSIGARDFIASITARVPREVTFESMEVAKDFVAIKGGASTEAGLAAFLNSIRLDERFNSVAVGEIQFNQRRGVIEFSVVARKQEVRATPQRRAPARLEAQ